MFLSRAADRLIYYINVGYYFVKLSVQRQVEYPLFLVSWFTMNFLQWFGGYYFIKILAVRFNGIAGWGFPELIFLFSLSLISHGLNVIFFIQTWQIGRMIIKGEFDQILLRPMDSFFLFIVRNVNFIGIADLIPGLIVFAYACKLLHFDFNPASMFKILVVVLGATLIRTSIFLITNSVSFWSNNRDRMTFLVLESVQNCSMYPLKIFPDFFQVVLTFILPIAFISYYPSTELLGKNQAQLPFTFIAFAIGLVLFAVGYCIFNKGIKKYESVGN